MKQLLLFLLISLSGALQAQEELLFEKQKTEPNRRQLRREIQFLEQLDTLENGLPPSKELLGHYNKLSTFYLVQLGDIEEAQYYNDIIFDFEPLTYYPKIKLVALNLKGRILSRKEQYAAAIANHFSALEMAIALEDTVKMSNTLQYIGRSFNWQKQYQEALKYLQQSLELDSLTNTIKPRTYQHIGLAYMFSKDYEKSKSYLQKVIQLSREQNRKNLATIAKRALAYISYDEGKFEESLDFLREVIKTKKRRKFPIQQASIWHLLASNYLRLDSLEQADFYAYKAYALSIQEGRKYWQIKSLDNLIELNKKRGQYSNAIQHLEEQKNLKDSLYEVDKLRLSEDYATLYETKEKEQQLFEQEEVIYTERRQKSQLLLIFSILGSLALGAFIVYRNRTQYQRTIAEKNVEIQQQKIKDLEQNQQLLSLSSMLEGQEAERLRIAQDLHDSVGGLLTSVKAHFTAIEQEISKLKSLNLYHTTTQLIDHACEEVRRISHNMTPHSLNLLGLAGAIEELSTQLLQQGITCELDLSDNLHVIAESDAVMIYRIIQELTNNTVKHAEASHILLQVLVLSDNIHILVEDDGKGFDLQVAQEELGLGMSSIQSRVRYLKGQLSYDSVLAVGTTVTIEIPRKEN